MQYKTAGLFILDNIKGKRMEKDFIKRLIQIRECRGLTQEQFGKALGVNKTTISRYENGERKPSFAFLARLREHFAADLNWLFTGKFPGTLGEHLDFVISMRKSLPEQGMQDGS